MDDATSVARVGCGTQDVLSGARRRFEMEYEHYEVGKREWYFVCVEALERSEGGAVITRSNITARHRARMEVEESRREVTHLARIGLLGQLSGSLAHELRQPLTSILANAQTAERILERRPIDVDELSTVLREIASEDQRAADIINGLHSMLRRRDAQAGGVDVESLVNSVLALAHSELVTQRVRVSSTIAAALPDVVADTVQMQQVLLNLMLNACEAMSTASDGSRDLHIGAALADRRNVRLSIRDTGVGIAPALATRLFEPFVTTKENGLGLGLSISRSIVSLHGGRIWAENNDGPGVTFFIELPATEADVVHSDAWTIKTPAEAAPGQLTP